MIYFTADTHLGHGNVIQYEHRPFQTAEEMDEALARNWNRKVSPEDDIYILGDFTLKGPEKANMFLERLQGCKYLIRGNHDGYVDRASFRKEYFLWIRDYYELSYRSQRFILCHYPLLTWKEMRRGSFQLHGHQHNHPSYNEYNRKMGIARLDVGVDAQDVTPVSAEALLAFWEEEHHPAEYWRIVKPSELRLEMTCPACPEQYNVFGKDGRYLGYLHLRGGSFTVNCIKPGEYFAEPVSEYTPMGWYNFMDEQERFQYLSIARRDIAEFYRALEKNHQYLRLTGVNTPASGLNGRWTSFSSLAGDSPPASCGLASPHLCSLAGPSEFFGSENGRWQGRRGSRAVARQRG